MSPAEIVKMALCEAGFPRCAATAVDIDDDDVMVTFSPDRVEGEEERAFLRALDLAGLGHSCWACWNDEGPGASPDCTGEGLCREDAD